MATQDEASAPVSAPAATAPAAPIDVRTLEPLLAAQAARGECSWPWLVRFLGELTRAVRASVRFFPPNRVEGPLAAHAQQPPPPVCALLDRQDDDFAAAIRRARKTLHRKATINDEEVVQIGTPLSGEGDPRGALILWIAPPKDQALEPFLVALQLVASFGQAAAPRESAGGDPRLAASLSSLSSRIAVCHDLTTAAQAFADEAVKLAGCDVAALALGRSGRWRTAAVSGGGRFDSAGALSGAVSAALRELEATPATAQTTDAGGPGLRELARHWDCRAVRPWLLPAGPGAHSGPGAPPVAALLLGFRQPEVCDADLARRLDAATQGWASLVAVSLRLGAGGAARELLGRLFRPFASVRRTAVWLLVLGLLTVAMLWPVPFSVRATARVEAADRRTVSASADGTLRENHVEVGQEVGAGQALGEMDDAEVLIRLSEARAARERALAQHAAAMARSDADAARGQLARLDVDAAEIEIRLLEHRLKGLALTAPVSGVVLRDASRIAGARVPLGTPLYEIAPASSIRLELDVPDDRIAYVREGQEVRIVLESFPGRSWRARVSKVHPQSELRDGANLFVVEAIPLDAASEWRPGMRGRASIEEAHRALGWVLFHPVVEFVEWILFW